MQASRPVTSAAFTPRPLPPKLGGMNHALLAPGAKAMRLCLPLIALACLATLPGPADAQWRWRDKTGQVNASDRPPPQDIPEKDIIGRPVPADLRRAGAAAAAVPASGTSAPAAASAPPTTLEREVQARKKAADRWPRAARQLSARCVDTRSSSALALVACS